MEFICFYLAMFMWLTWHVLTFSIYRFLHIDAGALLTFGWGLYGQVSFSGQVNFFVLCAFVPRAFLLKLLVNRYMSSSNMVHRFDLMLI